MIESGRCCMCGKEIEGFEIICSLECENRAARLGALLLSDVKLLGQVAVKMVSRICVGAWRARREIGFALLIFLAFAVASSVAPAEPEMEIELRQARD